MSHHNLKILVPWFEDILKNNKRFEIRINDRDFKVGDTVTLEEFDGEEQKFTGLQINVEIVYITDFEQRNGFVVFGFKLVD